MTASKREMPNEGAIYATGSWRETNELGRKIGSILSPNDIVCITGALGAGKTTLVQGVAEGLGVTDYVTSPTFIIINEYQGRIPFFHVDLYRLNDESEIEDLGIGEYFKRGGACAIEWAEKLGDLMPERYHAIKIGIISENRRKVSISSGLAALI